MRHASLSIAAILILSGADALAGPCFRRLVDANLDGARAVALADFDGDGSLDAVVASSIGDHIRVFLNDGAATPGFSDGAEIQSSGANGVRDLAVIDMDGDLDPDVVTPDRLNNAITWRRYNRATASFDEILVGAGASGVRGVAAGDVDGDGLVDVVSADTGAGRVSLWRRTGPTAFTRSDIDASFASVESVRVGDLDGDARADVVAVGPGPSEARWYEFDPVSGAFTLQGVITGLPGARALVITPITPGGPTGVAVACSSMGSVVWAAHDAASPTGFGAPVVVTASVDNIRSLDAADFDGDGDTDFLTASPDDDEVYWHEQTSPSVFEDRIAAVGIAGAWGVAAGDLDGDGDADAATAAPPADALHWDENPQAVNSRTGVVSRSLAQALADSLPGDAIFAEAELLGCEPTLDITAPGVTVVADGPVAREPSSVVTLGDQVELASPGEVRLRGVTRVTAGADAVVSGTSAVFSGRLDIAPNASLLSDAPETRFEGPAFASADVANNVGVLDVEIADLDLDGALDLVHVSGSGDRVVWTRSSGGADPVFTDVVIDAVTDNPARVVAADVDGDGRRDVLVATAARQSLVWLRNEPDDGDADALPQFVRQTLVDDGAGETHTVGAVAAADFTGDGATDLALVTDDPGQVRVLVSDGASPASFAPPLLLDTLPGARAVIALDLDLDGDQDLVVAADVSGRIRWYENVQASPLQFVPHDVSTDAPEAFAVAAGDLDGDGDLDLVSGLATELDTIRVHRNIGTDAPVFAEGVPLPVDFLFRRGRDVKIGDLDGDGDLDIAAVGTADDTIAWFENSGSSDPTFSPRLVATTALRTRAIELADLDADGDLDIVSAENLDGDVSWRQNARVATIVPAARLDATGSLSLLSTDLSLASAAETSAAAGLLVTPGSRLRAEVSTVAGDLTVAGELAVAPGGELLVTGDYAQSDGPSDGRLQLAIGSAAAGDPLQIAGAAELSGALRVTAPPGFAPPEGVAIPLLTAAGGLNATRFDAAILPGIPGGLFLALEYADGGARGAGSVSLVPTPLGSADVELDAAAADGLSGAPVAAVLADIAGFDGTTLTGPDSLPDLAVVTAGDQLVVLINAGSGGDGAWDGFSAATLALPIPPDPVSVAAGDLNGDDAIDLVVAHGPDGLVTVVLNDGAGALLPQSPVPLDLQPRTLVVADFDGDGFADAAVGGADGNDAGALVTLLSAGNARGAWAGFAAPSGTPIDGPAVSAGIGDLFDDKDLDLIVADSGTDAAHTLENLGVAGGTWQGFVVRQSVPAGPGLVQVVLADVDGDGDPDLVTTDRSGGSTTIALNDAGTLGDPASLPVGTRPRSLTLADLDGDLDQDIAVLVDDDANPGERLLRVLRNDAAPGAGQLVFAQALDVQSELRPTIALSRAATTLGQLGSADVDGDGDDDVVTVNQDPAPSARGAGSPVASAAALLQGLAPSPCPADLSGDGAIGAADLAIMVSSWGQPGPPDLDASGAVGASDLAALIGSWGPCDD